MASNSNDNANYKNERRAGPEPTSCWIMKWRAWQQTGAPPLEPDIKRSLVVVGGDSVFANAQAISDFYDLPAPPRTQRTTMPESFLLGLALQEDRENWPPVTICEISRTHGTDLEYRTHGRDVSVWHEDRPRSCWYPTAFRKECTEAEGASVVYTTRWQGEDGQLMDSPMPLRVHSLRPEADRRGSASKRDHH